MTSNNEAVVETVVNESTNKTLNTSSEVTVAEAPIQKDTEDASKDNSGATDTDPVVASETDAKASELTPTVESDAVAPPSKADITPVRKDGEVTSNDNSGATDTTPVVAVETDVKGSASGTTPAIESESSAKPAGIVVHHLNNSRSQRLLWLLEELQVPYEIKKYQRTAEMSAPQTLKEVHPLGKSPIITDGAVTLAESGAITVYLLEKYGAKFRPTEAGKLDDLYFTHYAEGSLMPIIVNKYSNSLIQGRSTILVRPIIRSVFSTIEKKTLVPQLKAHCELIESQLKKSKTGWLAGGDNPTSADFMMGFAAEVLVASVGDLVGPKTKEYVKHIHDRPAYKRGLEKGGKYDYA